MTLESCYDPKKILEAFKNCRNLGGGTAIYVKRSLNASFINIPNQKRIEATPIVLEFPNFPKLLIAAIYISPYSCSRAEEGLLGQELDRITRLFPNFILVGDFNAKHPFWNSRTFDHRGIKIRSWAEQNFVEIAAPPEPTYTPANSFNLH